MTDSTTNAGRLWRLACLLTGVRQDAAALIDEAQRRQPNLGALPIARQERLIVLCARDRAWKRTPRTSRFAGLRERLLLRHRTARGRGVAAEELAPDAESKPSIFGREAILLSDLRQTSEQALEAWILADIQSRDLIDIARVMDCSKTAAARHLEAARQRVAESLKGDPSHAIERIRRTIEKERAPVSIGRTLQPKKPLIRRSWFIVALAIMMIAVALLIARFV